MSLGAPRHWGEKNPQDVKLWSLETETDDKKKGVRLMRSLSGSGRAIVDGLSFDELVCEGGLKNIMKALKQHYKPHLEVSLASSLAAALHASPSAKEDFQDYIIRMDKAHTTLIQEGVKLPSEAKLLQTCRTDRGIRTQAVHLAGE